VRISERLKCVADNVTFNHTVADIGCDHAYTSIYLVKNKISPHVYAMDVNKGPLLCARKNVEMHGLTDKITIILSNGLKEVKPDYDIDTVLISGMGGNLMIDILTDGKINEVKYKELILQPQSHIADLRKYLHESGYKIVNEQMVYEDSKYYNIIKAVYGKDSIYTETEYEYGKILIDSKPEVFLQYLNYLYNKNSNIILKLKENSNLEDNISELHKKNETIMKIIN